ncbi:MAG: hypothetical protein MJZ35_00670 [Bacteroidaceae bacterium]|nr:hypothetical protein [Bacteroidaceae bacterium]
MKWQIRVSGSPIVLFGKTAAGFFFSRSGIFQSPQRKFSFPAAQNSVFCIGKMPFLVFVFL